MNVVKRSIASILALSMSFSAVCIGSTYSTASSSIVASAVSYSDVCTESSSEVWKYNGLTLTNGNSCGTNSNYLQDNQDGTISRIVATSDSVVVETYSSDFELLSSTSIDMELPIWGTFYSGSEYNFCVFGDYNSEEDNREVIRIVKYSKSWERLDSASFYGIDTNTQTPFTAGRPRIAEKDGKLYLHTSHKMLQIDGLNHQSNMQLYLNIGDMSTAYAQTDIANIDYNGYISHSFDQYILADDEDLYTLDLGDAYPRAVSIVKKSQSGTMLGYTDVFDIYGSVGNNATGVTLGGFELSTNNCISVGSSIKQDGSTDGTTQRNIFVGVTSRDLSSTNLLWLTDFQYSDTTNYSMVSAPKLVKLDDDNFLVMWNECKSDDSDLFLHVVRIDGSGKTLEDVSINGVTLSDCDPIVVGDRLLWYYCGYDADYENVSNIYHLDYTNLSQYDNVDLTDDTTTLVGDCNGDGEVSSLDLIALKKYFLLLDVDINLDNSDIDQDGEVTPLDLLRFKRYVLGLVDTLY